MWNEVIALYREYGVMGASIIASLIALVYLWKNEKRREFRIIFIYVPAVLLLIYFNPWFSEKVQESSGSAGYERLLWMLSFTVLWAYAIVHAYGKLSGIKRGIFACVLAVLIILAGSNMYQNPRFREAENIYYVPDSVVHICDAITVPGREVMAVFPEELLPYVRQYSPVTCMPYGQDIVQNFAGTERELYELMESDIIFLDELLALTRKYSCHYIVLPADTLLRGNPDYLGLVWFGETDGYAIYRDVKVELVVP